MEKDSLKENSEDEFNKLEPEVYVNAVHHFVMEKLHLFAGWLLMKTMPYVHMYEFELEDSDEESI